MELLCGPLKRRQNWSPANAGHLIAAQVTKDHDKHDLLEDLEDTGRDRCLAQVDMGSPADTDGVYVPKLLIRLEDRRVIEAALPKQLSHWSFQLRSRRSCCLRNWQELGKETPGTPKSSQLIVPSESFGRRRVWWHATKIQICSRMVVCAQTDKIWAKLQWHCIQDTGLFTWLYLKILQTRRPNTFTKAKDTLTTPRATGWVYDTMTIMPYLAWEFSARNSRKKVRVEGGQSLCSYRVCRYWVNGCNYWLEPPSLCKKKHKILEADQPCPKCAITRRNQKQLCSQHMSTLWRSNVIFWFMQ